MRIISILTCVFLTLSLHAQNVDGKSGGFPLRSLNTVLLLDDPSVTGDIHLNNVTGLDLDILNEERLHDEVVVLDSLYGLRTFDLSTFYITKNTPESQALVDAIADSLATIYPHFALIDYSIDAEGLFEISATIKSSLVDAPRTLEFLVHNLIRDRLVTEGSYSVLYDAVADGLAEINAVLSGELDMGEYFIDAEDEPLQETVLEFAYTYLAPSGIPVVIPPGYQAGIIKNPAWLDEEETLHVAMKEAIYSISHNGKTWVAKHDGNGNFLGFKYKSKQKKAEWYERSDYEMGRKVSVWIPKLVGDCGSYSSVGYIYTIPFPVSDDRASGAIVESVEDLKQYMLLPQPFPLPLDFVNVCLPYIAEYAYSQLKSCKVVFNPSGNDYGFLYYFCDDCDVPSCTGMRIYVGLADDGTDYYLMLAPGSQAWQLWEPNSGCDICEGLNLLFVELLRIKFPLSSGHLTLQLVGLVPGVGNIADIADGVLYLFEGNELEASISFGAAVIGVGLVVRGGGWALKIQKAGNSLVDAGLIRKLPGGQAENLPFSRITDKIDELGWSDIPSSPARKFGEDLNSNGALLKKCLEDPKTIEAWEKLLDFPILRVKKNALKYVDDLKVPKLGSSTTTNYRKTFKEVAFPEIAEDIHQVHHAMPQKIYNSYPGIMTQSELHSLQNLRGIPKSNPEFHQTITNNWAQFYLDFPNFTRQQALDFAKQMDDSFGHLFIPPIR